MKALFMIYNIIFPFLVKIKKVSVKTVVLPVHNSLNVSTIFPFSYL